MIVEYLCEFCNEAFLRKDMCKAHEYVCDILHRKDEFKITVSDLIEIFNDIGVGKLDQIHKELEGRHE